MNFFIYRLVARLKYFSVCAVSADLAARPAVSVYRPANLNPPRVTPARAKSSAVGIRPSIEAMVVVRAETSTPSTPISVAAVDQNGEVNFDAAPATAGRATTPEPPATIPTTAPLPPAIKLLTVLSAYSFHVAAWPFVYTSIKPLRRYSVTKPAPAPAPTKVPAGPPTDPTAPPMTPPTI